MRIGLSVTTELVSDLTLNRLGFGFIMHRCIFPKTARGLNAYHTFYDYLRQFRSVFGLRQFSSSFWTL